LTRGQDGVSVVDRLDPVDDVLVVGERPGVVDGIGVPVVARGLDEVRAAVAAVVARRGRIGADDLDVAPLLEVAAGAGDRAAGADTRDEVRDPALGRGPDLRAGGLVVDSRVGGVVVLVGEPAAGRLLRDATGQVVDVSGVFTGEVRRRLDDVGPVRAQHVDLFGRDGVRQDDDEAVTAHRGRLGEPDSRVAG
jgi:hypothetical protein